MRAESPKYLSAQGSSQWNTAGVLLDEAIGTAGTPIDFEAMFGNNHPVEVEIGSGKGTFLLARASARPEINFLGIEWARPYCLHAADRLRRHGLTNVRMLRTDAGPFFAKSVPPESLLRLHIYFPDPWPKKRHNRRRIIQMEFVESARKALRIGGQLLVVTDHLNYFEHMRRVLMDFPGFATVPMPRMTDSTGEIVGTNFEKKYIAQGRPFFSIAKLRYR